MMSKLASCVLFATVPFLISGCGDDDGAPSPEENTESKAYFEQSLAISKNVNTRIRELKTIYPDNYFDVAEKESFDLQQTRDSYQEYVDLYTEFLDRMEALDPPEALNQLHEDNLEVNRDVNAISEARLERLQSANSLADVEAVFEPNEDFDKTIDAADEVCNEFRDTAIANGVDWDQPCQRD